MEKCIYCGKEPRLVEITGLWYAQCGCAKRNPYEFVGARKTTTIDMWNEANNDKTKVISMRVSVLKKLHAPYIWVVDGVTYTGYHDILPVIKCSYSTLRKHLTQDKKCTTVVNGHVVVRITKEV